MASVEEILLNFVGKDNVSNVQNKIKSGMNEIGTAASSANSKIKDMGNIAGQVGTKFTSGMRSANSLMSRIGSIGQSAFRTVERAGVGAIQSISSKVRSLGQQIEHLGNQMDAGSSAIQGAMGGIGFTQIAQPVMGGAMTKEQGTIQLQAKFGADSAQQIQAQLAQVAAVTPGDDSILKQILTKGAMDSNLTSMQQMKSIAQAYAGYAAGSAASGKQMAEVQRDIVDYLFNGSTSVLEIDSIYRDHIDELKQGKTTAERIEIINRLNKEHYNDILAQSNSLNNVWQMFLGYITSAATDLGMSILPIVKMVVSGLITLNEMTGGWAFKIAIAAGLVGTAFIALFGTIGILLSGIVSLGGSMFAMEMFMIGIVPAQIAATWATEGFAAAVTMAGRAVLAFLLTNPVGWAILLITAVVALITYFGKWGDVINFVKGLWNGLTSWDGWKILEDKVKGLVDGANQVGQKVGDGLQNASKGAQDWVGQLDSRWKAFWDTAEGKDLNNEFMKAFNELKGAGNEVFTSLGGLWKELVDAFKPLLDIFKPATQGAQQTGGAINGATGAANNAQPAFDAIGTIIWILVGAVRAVILVIRYMTLVINNAIMVGRIIYSVFHLLIYGPIMVGQTIFKGLADSIQWVIDKINGLIGAVNNATAPLQGLWQQIQSTFGGGGGGVPFAPPAPAPAPAMTPANTNIVDAIKQKQAQGGILPGWGSPLELYRPTRGATPIGTTPLVKFPQLTPEVLDNIGKGATGPKGSTKINQTTVQKGAVQIDATGMNPKELEKTLIVVFESLNKGTAPNKKSTTQA